MKDELARWNPLTDPSFALQEFVNWKSLIKVCLLF
jgi:hypothetical protein